MLNFLLGVVIGCVGGYVAKKQSDKKRHYNESGVSYASLYDVSQTELQKLKNHIKSQQEEHDELTCEIQSLKHKIRSANDVVDDKGDLIIDLKQRVEILKREKNTAEEKMLEYKDLYTSATQEIERLKIKLDKGWKS